jgi:dTDP-glucose 4,6-dehydratase
MKMLVTGGMGFIGSCFVRLQLGKENVEVVNLDKLTYSGNPATLADLEDNPNYSFIKGDITDHEMVRQAMSGCNVVVHFAAEAQVDKSITGPEVFTKTNVLGTQVLLDVAREQGVERFHYVSTDEVYGHLGDDGFFTEGTALLPNSPYSASKAGGDLLCRAYHQTFAMPITVTRCSNNYGPYPRLDNLIPVMTLKALADASLPVYGNGLNVRDWLYVEDHCTAIDAVLEKAKPGDVYNVGGHNEKTNLEVVKLILQELGKSEDLITFVPDRPGHDFRYAIDADKIERDLGWTPAYTFEDALPKTVRWIADHPEWVASSQAHIAANAPEAK